MAGGSVGANRARMWSIVASTSDSCATASNDGSIGTTTADAAASAASVASPKAPGVLMTAQPYRPPSANSAGRGAAVCNNVSNGLPLKVAGSEC